MSLRTLATCDCCGVQQEVDAKIDQFGTTLLPFRLVVALHDDRSRKNTTHVELELCPSCAPRMWEKVSTAAKVKP